jgi:hypothetical protein
MRQVIVFIPDSAFGGVCPGVAKGETGPSGGIYANPAEEDPI